MSRKSNGSVIETYNGVDNTVRSNLTANGDFFAHNIYLGDTDPVEENTQNIILNSDGLGEFKGGVKVSGGIGADVVDGIGRVANNQINIYRQGDSSASFGVNFASGFNQIRAEGRDMNNVEDMAVAGFITNVGSFENVGSGGGIRGCNVQLNSPSGLAADVNLYGFNVGGSSTSTLNGAINYGYYSDININADSGKQNYSFYAEGTAPNFFKGDVEVGTDNTTGVVLTSPSGNKFRLTVDDAGNLSTVAV